MPYIAIGYIAQDWTIGKGCVCANVRTGGVGSRRVTCLPAAGSGLRAGVIRYSTRVLALEQRSTSS
eukprot:gene2461-5395_t